MSLGEIVHAVFYELAYWQVALVVYLYFLVLYFGIGFLFRKLLKAAASRKLINPINQRQIDSSQIRFEIKNSLNSIFVFSMSSLLLVYLFRSSIIRLGEDSFSWILFSLLLLNIWNEIHFYLVHKWMHSRFFYRRVHHIHHQSRVPTTFSVYSFHWFEALLLSSVPVLIAPFIALAPIAIFLYPICSILINFIGHSNYQLKSSAGFSPFNFSQNHNEHHQKVNSMFGFLFNIKRFKKHSDKS